MAERDYECTFCGWKAAIRAEAERAVRLNVVPAPINPLALLALLDEITRLRAERDEAYRRGAEEMRERVIDFFDRNKVYSGLEVRELVRGYLFDPSKGGGNE